MIARATLIMIAALVLGGCAKKIEHPPMDVTFLPQRGDFVSQDGERLSLAEVVDMASSADYVLVGEGHRNACDHNVQQTLLAALAATDRPPAVGLEMVAVDMQPVLDDFAQGLVPVDDLEAELEWKKRWGYPFSLFKGLFEIANRNSLPVAGLNAPSSVTRKIARQGMDALDDWERDLLPAEIVPPADEQMEYLNAMFELHGQRDHGNPEQRERFMLVQSIWDSKMAEEAVKLRKKFNWPVFIVAGSGHVENGWGIARRIERFDPGAAVFSLMPWRGGEFLSGEGDVFFSCPDSYVSRMGATLTATGSGGLLVDAVKRDSRAYLSGLRPGDVLVEAGGLALDELFDLHMAGSKVYESGGELIFNVRRGGETFKVNVGKLGQGR